jgi:hypothetical protein
LCCSGHHDVAYRIGAELLESFPDDYLLNLELGVIQVSE